MPRTPSQDLGFWQQAFADHGPSVLAFLERRLGRREEAEDLLQETFVRAMRAASFQPEAGPLRAYLLRIAKNLLINRLRRPRLVLAPEAGNDEDQDPFEQTPDLQAESPEAGLIWSTFRQRLRQALGVLSRDHRRAFDLVCLEQCSYSEVARLTGWSPAQVKVNVFRARRKVLAELADVLPSEGVNDVDAKL